MGVAALSDIDTGMFCFHSSLLTVGAWRLAAGYDGFVWDLFGLQSKSVSGVTAGSCRANPPWKFQHVWGGGSGQGLADLCGWLAGRNGVCVQLVGLLVSGQGRPLYPCSRLLAPVWHVDLSTGVASGCAAYAVDQSPLQLCS